MNMQIILKRIAIAAIPCLLLLTSCKKNLSPDSVSTSTTAKDGANTYFNWQTATAMPVPANSTVQVSLPWQSQSGSYIDPYLISDYNMSDGWDMVYCTFNTSTYPYLNTLPAGGLYFALYNKFRGLLRFYLYLPPGLFGGTSDIQHGLSVLSDNGTTTKMLNFDGTGIVDPNVNTAASTKTNNVGVAVGGGWYVMQYQIAYDPAFASTVYPHLGINWNSQTVDISQIDIAGASVGTLTGQIAQKSSGFNWTGTLINLAATVAEIYGVNDDNTNSELDNAASNGLAGNATGLLSGIFGGNSSNGGEVDLSMNATIAAEGTLTSSQPLTPNSLVFPGQTTTNSVGAPLPLVTYPLGLFNLTARPTIDETITTSIVDELQGGVEVPYNLTTDSYSVDPGFSSLFVTNPNINGLATIENLKTDVVALNPNTSSAYQFQTSGTEETIGSYTAYTGLNNLVISYLTEHQPPTNSNFAVRVSFNVVPTNGRATTFVVKTFLANVVVK